MHRKAAAFLIAAAPLAAAPLAAQTPVRVGQTVNGTLDAGDPVMDGTPYESYTITGAPGDRVLVRLRSDDFDAYLRWGRLRNGEWEESAANDDGGSGTDSRLVVTLGANGYQLRAGAFGEGQTGAYTLELSEPVTPRPGRIRAGERVTGTLDESDYEAESGFEDHYVLTGRAGDVVTVFAESAEFDAYLSAGTWTDGNFAERSSDDDSGQSTNAQLVVEMDGLETYIVVRSFSGETGGGYTLRVEEGAAEPAEDGDEIDIGGAEGEDFEEIEEIELEDAELVGSFAGPVQAGRTVNGTLGDGAEPDEAVRHYLDYSFTAAAGERIVIRMDGELDPYLFVGRGQGEAFEALAEDDDGGDALDARVEFQAPQAGTYIIRATTAFGGQTGPFTLSVEREP